MSNQSTLQDRCKYCGVFTTSSPHNKSCVLYEEKSFDIQNFLDTISLQHYGISRTAAKEQGICVSCKNEAKEFTDKKSWQEYRISALCQNCQDLVFGKG